MEIQEAIKEKSYFSNEVCEILNEKKYNIIYMEKALGLNIVKDKLSRKLYTEKDIEILRRAKTLKSKNGLSYEAIKEMLVPSAIDKGEHIRKEEYLVSEKEIAISDVQAEEKSSNFIKPDSECLKEIIAEVINDRVNEILDQKLEVLKSYIENEFEYLRKQNSDIKTKMEIDIENYASEVSIKIDSLKRSMERNKKGFFR